MLIISVLGIYPIPVYRGACPIVRRCGLSSDTVATNWNMYIRAWHSTVSCRPRVTSATGFAFTFSPISSRDVHATLYERRA